METKLIVGLGNPESIYGLTRHNIGYIIINTYDTCYGFTNSMSCGIDTKNKIIKDTRIILLKPQDCMNMSGVAVNKVAKREGIDNKDILIIHDDMDLDFGKIKISASGGSGGHKGIQSIINNLGQDFNRYRVGISRPPKDRLAADYVLSNFTAHEINTFCSLTEMSREIIDYFIETDVQKVMNKYNKKEPVSNEQQ